MICLSQFRCALRIPVMYTLKLQPLSTGVGEGEALGGDLTIGEQKIIAKLRESFPDATDIQVSDISGEFTFSVTKVHILNNFFFLCYLFIIKILWG